MHVDFGTKSLFIPITFLRLMTSDNAIPTLLQSLYRYEEGRRNARHHFPLAMAATLYAEHGQKTFRFQPRRGKLDLRTLSRLDVDHIAAHADIDALHRHVENLTFAALTEEDLAAHSDQAVVKSFRLAQLAIEYLLNIQDCLAHQLDRMAVEYVRTGRKMARLRQRVKVVEESEPPGLNTAVLPAMETDTAVSFPNSPRHGHRHHHHRRRHHHRRYRNPHEGQRSTIPDSAAPPPNTPGDITTCQAPPQILRLYVTFVDGSCVMLTASPSLVVRELKAQILEQLPPAAAAQKFKLTRKKPRLQDTEVYLNYCGRYLPEDKTLVELKVPTEASLLCLAQTEEEGGAREEEAEGKAASRVTRMESELARISREHAEEQRRLQSEQEGAMTLIQERLSSFEQQVLSFLERQAQPPQQPQTLSVHHNPPPPPSPPPLPPPPAQAPSVPMRPSMDRLSIQDRVSLLMSQVEGRILQKAKDTTFTATEMARVRELRGLLSDELHRAGREGAPLGARERQGGEQAERQEEREGDRERNGTGPESTYLERRMAVLNARRLCLPSRVKDELDKIQTVNKESLMKVPPPFHPKESRKAPQDTLPTLSPSPSPDDTPASCPLPGSLRPSLSTPPSQLPTQSPLKPPRRRPSDSIFLPSTHEPEQNERVKPTQEEAFDEVHRQGMKGKDNFVFRPKDDDRRQDDEERIGLDLSTSHLCGSVEVSEEGSPFSAPNSIISSIEQEVDKAVSIGGSEAALNNGTNGHDAVDSEEEEIMTILEEEDEESDVQLSGMDKNGT